ncbi:MAG: cysteine synthase A [Clostridia bacterium]|nr:cysteine synthase A [Clostridia bacterium]
MIYKKLEDLIGKTPLYEPKRFEKACDIHGRLLCKLESFNPAGSAKDRIALAMLDEAEKSGKLRPGGTVIEPTSGNTGIGLAAIAAARGYRMILTMPDTMSPERRALLAAYGAELVLTPGKAGMKGAVNKALELAKKIPDSFIPSQFDNPANPAAHYRTTGPEIWKDAKWVDGFVAGVGTGGTISGVGKYLKEQNPDCFIAAVEPAASPLLSRGITGPHGLQGIGANFVPENLSRGVLDDVIAVTEEEAFKAAKAFANAEGLLVGISSGAALHAAMLLLSRPEWNGATFVALLPDTGERYLSTQLFQ